MGTTSRQQHYKEGHAHPKGHAHPIYMYVQIPGLQSSTIISTSELEEIPL